LIDWKGERRKGEREGKRRGGKRKKDRGERKHYLKGDLIPPIKGDRHSETTLVADQPQNTC